MMSECRLHPPSTLLSNEALTWFRRAETQFRLKNIVKATTKADHVVAVLPEEVSHRRAPWLDSQPDDIDYNILKQELLKEFSYSLSERVRQILNDPNTPLGDRTPKESLAGNQHPIPPSHQRCRRKVLRSGNIREKLHDSNETITEVLARANALMEAHRQTRPQSAAPVFPSASTDINAATPRGFNTDWRPFTPFLAADGIRSYHKRFGTTARGTNTNWRPFAQYLAADGICSYHKQFGNAAYHCLNGCRCKPRRHPKQHGRWPLRNTATILNNAVNRPQRPALPHYRRQPSSSRSCRRVRNPWQTTAPGIQQTIPCSTPGHYQPLLCKSHPLQRQQDQPHVVPREFLPNNGPSNTQLEDLRQVARQFAASRPIRRSHHPPYTSAGWPCSSFHHDVATYTRSGCHSRPRRILALKSFLLR
ncbi:hypothetical protein C7M84_016309 [Penaeus vannamei]|uniref:DUF7041 domain-containing protein n=1 Tax=Penaeus vannamei TaxID=6689 RepID=A0A423SN85_PENVA|nr:hypothetical protein C7M84_016309 [Penaeus vannamei]